MKKSSYIQTCKPAGSMLDQHRKIMYQKLILKLHECQNVLPFLIEM